MPDRDITEKHLEASRQTVEHADAARNLLRMGFETPQISEATGLSLEEIEALRDPRA